MRLDLLQSAQKYYIMNPDKTGTQSVPAGLEEFPELTRTTGTMPGKYTIKLEPGAKGVVHPVSRQPAALRGNKWKKMATLPKSNSLLSG